MTENQLRLKAAIVGKYGSQERFALALGASDWLVSRVVRGIRHLTPTEGDKWVDLLGCGKDILPIREHRHAA